MAQATPEHQDSSPRKVPPPPKGAQRKVRIHHLNQMMKAGRPIAMVTAYDAVTASLADEAGIDVILIGDSAGTTVHGFETTLPVTLEMMIIHTQAVVRGANRPLIVADLPFMSYQLSPEQALASAGRVLKEGGAEAVKLETCSERSLPSIRAIVDSGIPVMGHIGLVPQALNQLSGYRVQGRGEIDGTRLLELARKVEAAGAFAIVLELIPSGLAARITAELTIPTIGIGAGAGTDGQVLVMNDLLGLTPDPPRFARKYVDLRAGIVRALRKYGRDVRERSFPAEEHEFH